MFKFSKVILFTSAAVTLSACTSKDEPNPLSVDPTPNPTSTTSNTQSNIDILYGYMKSEYFWNAALPEQIDNTAWASVPEALAALKGPQDKYSWAIPNTEYAEWANSKFFGFGFDSVATEGKDSLIVRNSLDGSSAYEKGLRRGDVITHLNGNSVESVIANGELDALLGSKTTGQKLQVTFKKPNGDELAVELEKGSRTVKSVLAAQVKDISINNKPTKLGYLVFNTFVSDSAEELETAFESFNSAGVEELILDLRYNGGGQVAIAQQLAQQIGGTNVDNKVFAKYTHNDIQSSKDTTFYFNANSADKQLNLNRVVVLTSPSTCSASELVVNSLNPFLDVVLIGEETCGKPYGMYVKQIGTWSVAAINFQTSNAVDFGNYD